MLTNRLTVRGACRRGAARGRPRLRQADGERRRRGVAPRARGGRPGASPPARFVRAGDAGGGSARTPSFGTGCAGQAGHHDPDELLIERLHLQPLDEELVGVMMAGLTGAPVPNEGVRADPPPASPPDPSHANERAERARRAATAPRPARPPLPVASLAISLAEATWPRSPPSSA